MPNFWHYSIVLTEQSPFSKATFDHVLAAFAAADFTPTHPDTKRIVGMSVDGLHPLEFTSLQPTLEYLSTHQGSLTFYNTIDAAGRVDINVDFSATPPQLTLSVFRDLYAEDPERVMLAKMLEQIFIGLCRRLKPRYGYSSDDWTLEFILPNRHGLRLMEEFANNTQVNALPPIVFWLNYFSSPQDTEVMKRMGEIAYRQRRVAESGTLIYLSDHPWNSVEAVIGDDGLYGKV